MRRTWTFAAVLGIGLMLVGCSGELDATVTGKVTVDDRAAPLGEVTFYPADGDTNRPTPRGMISPDGTYSLKVGANSGLPSGQYKATVMVMEMLVPASENQPPGAKPLSPPRYGDPKTSGFEFTVKPGSNRIDLPLKGK